MHFVMCGKITKLNEIILIRHTVKPPMNEVTRYYLLLCLFSKIFFASAVRHHSKTMPLTTWHSESWNEHTTIFRILCRIWHWRSAHTKIEFFVILCMTSAHMCALVCIESWMKSVVVMNNRAMALSFSIKKPPAYGKDVCLLWIIDKFSFLSSPSLNLHFFWVLRTKNNNHIFRKLICMHRSHSMRISSRRQTLWYLNSLLEFMHISNNKTNKAFCVFSCCWFFLSSLLFAFVINGVHCVCRWMIHTLTLSFTKI